MEMDNQFSVGAALRRAQIIPRNEPYALSDIQEALRAELSFGKNVQINCLRDKKTRQTLLGDVRMCLDKLFRPIDCPRAKSNQPLTYIIGHPPPLPSFNECPASVVYLPDTSSRVIRVAGLEHREITFWINPLITMYSTFFSVQKPKQEFLWGVSVPFVAIVLFIYYKSGRDF
ncbi:hypothetical protein OESDEN_06463 [Oesophagostomum dentatum]|uniref:Uncharacterized protein n=1 Tax=Oesophagostomum dentatum TaxID=61180 RepID=A0A0B1TCT4_OESDE|nr:hypothetical protein OESDEN_06463 [Oesophagostomum dentatum]